MNCTIRGAITSENNKEAIDKDTTEMLKVIIEQNKIEINQITSVLFTCTADLTKAYPAVSARQLGITEASLMCMQELFVEGSLERCIRCMVTIETDKKQNEMLHVYLKEAAKLRPDLAKGSK